ncbi:thiosulfate reductase cytochrome b subunit [Silvibacterium bohemicum]|uniref:Thiosulfate reductase cytochrome b subunit n=1 Tax=Silvibacterium bohemicum TaxID=1577686 RepID=A0A841JR50_9BACT|nr:cytochrome b/b6 domain-containing protein [Silvibacterium bohemicum]MBB6143017.1 thiosulfate reductase cytochrome b subunit [Silvibacterium bohemicum]
MDESNGIRLDDSSNPPPEKSSLPGERQVIETDAPALGVQAEESNADQEPKPAERKRTTVRVEYKHSLATRWMHWINFPLLFVMIYSGILIYWADSQHEGLNAHHVYRIGIGDWTLFRFFPRWFYNNLNLKYQLAQGLAYHFFFMWFFALNGIAYVLYTVLSGEWRNLVPTRHSLAGAFHVVLHDLGLSKRPLPEQKFNDAQRIAYTGVVLMGVGSLLTGLAIYKPTQLHIITALLGGYEMARWFHFWLTLSYVGFFLMHVAQVIRAGWNNFRAMLIGYQVVPAQATKREEVSSGQDAP